MLVSMPLRSTPQVPSVAFCVWPFCCVIEGAKAASVTAPMRSAIVLMAPLYSRAGPRFAAGVGSLAAQGGHRIDACGAPGGDVAGEQGHDEEDDHDDAEGRWIGCGDAV